MDRQPRRVLGLATALIAAGVSFVAPALAQNQASTVAGDFCDGSTDPGFPSALNGAFPAMTTAMHAWT